ncbi:MAG: ExbD/TolR family protein [Thermoguttaceae bacterium]
MQTSRFLRHHVTSINLTPMIDVVFLLIIFFLVSSTFIQQEVSLEMQLPTAQTGQKAEEDITRKEIINIPGSGQLLLRTEPVSLEKLREYFRVRKTTGEENIPVLLRVAQGVPYQEVEPVLLLCAESGIWNVSFAVLREE